jgi:hypothetical protein
VVVAQRIDPSELVDSDQVKDILGLSSRNAVRVYRGRYADFPLPVIERGRCVLWLANDMRKWAQARGLSR